MKRLFSIHLLILLVALAALSFSTARSARADTPNAASIPVVFVPGIGGTRLADAENVEYWTAAGYTGHDLLTLYPSQLHPTLYPTNAITQATFLGIHIPSEDWQTYGPVFAFFASQGFVQYNTYQNPSYQTSAGCDLTQAPNHPNLFVFAYDWRISNAQNATLLADYIACVQKFYPNTNVNIVAHSMGGLVARRYIIDHLGTHHVNAFISVGSPFLGASKVVWVEETGEYVFFVWASTLLNVVGSFNGASELLNSQAWYDIGGLPALVENGQDLNGNGKTNEQFSYPMLVSYMDTAKGKEGFLPGTQNQTFHSYSNGGNNQDDWRNDTTGVKYFHIVGEGLVPDTINQVVAASLWNCLKNYSICDLSTWMYPKYTQGDQTVPLLSSSRIGNLNLNAPNATVYECQAFGANNQNVDHTGMLSNPVVQNLLVGYLAQANGGAVVDPPPSLACGQGQNSLAAPQGSEDKYHQVVIHGAKEIEITDGTADQFPDTVSRFDGGRDGSAFVFGTGKAYTLTFRATNTPLYLEWTYRDAQGVTRAVRYRDVALPPNALARINLSDGLVSPLAYDSDNDDTVDTSVAASANLKDADARDTRPPKIKVLSKTVGAKKHITLSVKERGSGLAVLVYSLDGKHFQPYTAPFSVDASVKTIYAIADDNAGNRSRAVKFRVK